MDDGNRDNKQDNKQVINSIDKIKFFAYNNIVIQYITI